MPGNVPKNPSGQNQPKLAKNIVFDGSDFWPHSLLETDEKPPYDLFSKEIQILIIHHITKVKADFVNFSIFVPDPKTR